MPRRFRVAAFEREQRKAAASARMPTIEAWLGIWTPRAGRLHSLLRQLREVSNPQNLTTTA
jgi:hypothetical protein